MKPSPSSPLGVFDSGLGGLTVVRALRALLPHEDILYLGDTARVPYGTKGEGTVVRYAAACAKHLVKYDVKAIVIACNTVSAVAPERLRAELDLPIIGVIEPGAEAAVRTSVTGKIGVLATQATINSGAYARAVMSASTRAEVVQQAAPLLVPLVEEGWLEGDVPKLAIERYLEPFVRAKVDTIVLGCTHYPLLRPLIEEAAKRMISKDVRIIDSASAVASTVATFLQSRSLANTDASNVGKVRIQVTDLPRSFELVATRFLGNSAEGVEQVDLIP
ncbi:MAG: glutamate racemase [Polyangiaceae bacterium]|nr:glutamate racemase [Polyangiaceae bacterium]